MRKQSLNSVRHAAGIWCAATALDDCSAAPSGESLAAPAVAITLIDAKRSALHANERQRTHSTDSN